MREKETHREREGETERQRDREIETERERGREREAEREREKGTERKVRGKKNEKYGGQGEIQIFLTLQSIANKCKTNRNIKAYQ